MNDYPQVWEEPVRGGYPDPSALSLSGLERMRAWVKGQLPNPPIGRLIGMRPVEAGVGTCTFVTPASEWLQSGTGHYAGGVGALVADASLGCAVLSGVAPWSVIATSQLSMSFLRPAGPWSGRLTARGKLIHTTPTVGLSEVHVEDVDGRLIAHGTSRCFIQRIKPFETEPFVAKEIVAPSYDTPDPYLRPVQGESLPSSTWADMSGLEWARALKTGETPPSPLGTLLGYQMIVPDEGAVTLAMENHEWLCNPARMVYGGAIANIAHDAMAMALHTTLPKGTTYATLDLTVNFVRPAPPDRGKTVARAHVLHKGRTFGVTGADVKAPNGKTVATATASWMILEGRPFPDQRDYAREFPSTG